jgi:hypothetical protein
MKGDAQASVSLKLGANFKVEPFSDVRLENMKVYIQSAQVDDATKACTVKTIPP